MSGFDHFLGPKTGPQSVCTCALVQIYYLYYYHICISYDTLIIQLTPNVSPVGWLVGFLPTQSIRVRFLVLGREKEMSCKFLSPCVDRCLRPD